jgi:hypothetical protein
MSEGMTRAIAWLTAWDSQGIHCTATAGDEAGAEWLAREAADLGATPAVEEFALDRLDPIVAYLEFDGRRVPGVPIFDAPATGPDGVSPSLGGLARRRPSLWPSCRRSASIAGITKMCAAMLSIAAS